MFKKAIQDCIQELDTSKVHMYFKKTKKLYYGIYPFKIYFTSQHTITVHKKIDPDIGVAFNSGGYAYYDNFDEVCNAVTALIKAQNLSTNSRNERYQFIRLELTIPDDQEDIDNMKALQNKISKLEIDNKSIINVKFVPKKSPNKEYNTRVVLSLNKGQDDDGKQQIDDFISYMKEVYGDCVHFNPRQIGYYGSLFWHKNYEFKLYIYIPDVDDGLMFIPHLNHKFVTGIKSEVFMNDT